MFGTCVLVCEKSRKLNAISQIARTIMDHDNGSQMTHRGNICDCEAI